MSFTFKEFLQEAARGYTGTKPVHDLIGERGYARRRRNPAYLGLLREAGTLLLRAYEGRIGLQAIQEALSTSDFPYLMGDTMERMLVERYRVHQPVWNAFMRRRTLRDFRASKMLDLQGGGAALEVVGQYEAYPEDTLAESQHSISVLKHGKVIRLAWEVLINDDLDAFRALPDIMYESAINAESRKTVGHYAANATIYSNVNKNVLNTTNGAGTDNPSFGINAVMDFWKVLSKQRDVNGNPIVLDDMQVVIDHPPALEPAVKNFLSAVEINITQGPATNVVGAGTNPGYEMRVLNWMKGSLRGLVNPWLPVLDQVTGDTRFYFHLVGGGTRTPFYAAFLRGYESPQVFTKNAGHNGTESDGAFEDDSHAWKVRHMIGAGTGDTKMTYTSSGTNS